MVLDQGAEISGALGAAVAAQRVVVERGSFFVCDKSHKRQRGALLCGARPSGRGYISQLAHAGRVFVDFFWGGGPCGRTHEWGAHT